MQAVDHDLGTKNLRLEADGPILWCIIDRPQARHALTPALVATGPECTSSSFMRACSSGGHGLLPFFHIEIAG